MITLDLQSRLPIYEQLKENISKLILSGDLKADDQLPSVRNFARDLGINPNTVQKAYQSLEQDGLIYSVTGRGSFISPNSDLVEKILDEYRFEFKKSTVKAKNAGLKKDDLTGIIGEVYGKEN